MCFIRGTIDIPHSRWPKYNRRRHVVGLESASCCSDSITPTLWHSHSVILNYLGTSLLIL
ncbi:hypothetical protein Syun_021190 [Stephania yunnanensis]|uniref:Uncharacterized protein n=1 Tax=Stephania yunnanensis TaxID=152371 RepID=A0AAP0IG49_9MAGN